MNRIRLFIASIILSGLLLGGILFTAGCEEAPYAEDISALEAWELVSQNLGNPDFAVIDVRTPEEFASGHIEGALNIDVESDSFREDMDALERVRVYMVHCRTGNRSRRALTVMEELEFRDVFHLSGGILEWEEEGLPLVR